MTATYTYDVFSSLDGFGTYDPPGDWGPYWGKQGPELLARRSAIYDGAPRMVFGATTFRDFQTMSGDPATYGEPDPWVEVMRGLPTTVLSSTLSGPLDWPDATIEADDAAAVVARLKETSEVPLLSHGSIRLNRALLAAGLVDVLQVTVFPVVAGTTGADPLFPGAPGLDLELVGTRTFDGRTLELTYRPHLH